MDLFPRQEFMPRVSSTLLPKPLEKWFLRLDFCSTKDAAPGTGEEGDSKSVDSVDGVVRRLVTSRRAVTALEDHMRLVGGMNVHERAKIFLFPFRGNVMSGREYRVFCPPSPKGMEYNRVTAVSQDRYHELFFGSRVGESTKVTARRVLDGILKIHRRILETAVKGLPWLEYRIKEERFVFDVFDPVDGEVQFVEMNPFGAMSGCGSALFHWIKDAMLLYGFEGAREIEFRVTIDNGEEEAASKKEGDERLGRMIAEVRLEEAGTEEQARKEGYENKKDAE